MKYILFQISGYDYRINTWITGTILETLSSLDEAITFCNSHSDCKGIQDVDCDGGLYYAMGGTPTPDNWVDDCSWVRNSYS